MTARKHDIPFILSIKIMNNNTLKRYHVTISSIHQNPKTQKPEPSPPENALKSDFIFVKQHIRNPFINRKLSPRLRTNQSTLFQM